MVALTIVVLVSGAIVASGLVFYVYSTRYGASFFARTKSLKTMVQFRQAVGEPIHVSTNRDGIILWDYTRTWTATEKAYFYTNGELYRIFTE